MTFDLVLRGGEVFDGTSLALRKADIAIEGGRIVAIGDLGLAEATQTLDVTSLSIAPGFIDVHAHTDLVPFLDDEHMDVKAAGIRQGVTTEVSGNCGSSPFPTRSGDRNDPYLGSATTGRSRFSSLAEYKEAVALQPMIANMAPLLGHGAVRAFVVGREDRAPTDDELVEMRRVVVQGMDEGAFGFSTGLIYAPGMFSRTEEIIALASEAAPYRRPYTTHMRDEGDRVTDAIDEALRIGREAGVGVEISHHKIAGRRNWGRSNVTLKAIEDARASGVDVTIDVYPYTAGSTMLAAVLPPWVLDGGPKMWLERMKDPSVFERIEKDIATGLPNWQNLAELAGWENVVIAGEPPFAGRSVAENAQSEGMSEVAFVAKLLIDQPMALIIIHIMDEQEVVTIGDQPFALVGSDGIPVPGMQHPRLAGTFARMLHRHAGHDRALADTVRRMSFLPAQRFAIPDRGEIAVGKIADLVVFDRATVADRSTYEEPFLTPVGIPHVLMGGEFVVRDGEVTTVRPGAVLEPA